MDQCKKEESLHKPNKSAWSLEMQCPELQKLLKSREPSNLVRTATILGNALTLNHNLLFLVKHV